MDNCLLDYIGILTCPDGSCESDSGLYINSLPGISLESVEKIATQDQINYAGVWKDVQNQAWIRFKVSFIAQLTKCFELSKKCDYVGIICANKDILATAWMYLLGNQMMMFRLYSNRLNRYTTLDTEKAQELLDFYQTEFESALEQAAQLCDVSICECLQPGGQITTVYEFPGLAGFWGGRGFLL